MCTWNTQRRHKARSIIQYLRKRKLDILTIQEPSKTLTDKASMQSHRFIKDLHTFGYRATITPHTITNLNTNSLGAHLDPSTKTSEDGRIQISLIHTATHTALAIVNCYAPQINHKERSSISASLINFLNDTIPTLTQSPAHLKIIAMGDFNMCIQCQTPLPNNLLHYFERAHMLTSSIPYHHHRSHPLTPLPATISTGNTHIDHILLPLHLLTISHTYFIDKAQTETESPSDHYPCNIHTLVHLQQTRQPPPIAELPPPPYKILQSIPVKLSPGSQIPLKKMNYHGSPLTP